MIAVILTFVDECFTLYKFTWYYYKERAEKCDIKKYIS